MSRALVGIAFGLLAWSCHRRAQADLHSIAGQNVLLITIDTLRADALSCYGGQAATPVLDRLASEGVRFDFAHAHSVLTLPSHISILTGQYPFQHGVRDNSGYRVAPDTRTAATLLKRAGYRTAAFVAAFPLHSRFGLNQGFDVYDDRFGESRAPTEFAMPERPAADMVPIARAWLAQRVKSPDHEHWFAWLHVFDPHAPYRPPAPFDARYAARPYYGEVAATDAALAPLLEDPRASTQPTLVIVTGDHGEGLGEHGEQSHGLFAYEATLRVPLIIAEMGNRASSAGEVSSVPARHVDILPTILDAVGQALPSDLPGRTLLPAAERSGGSSPRPSYFEAMGAMLNRGWAPLAGVLIDRDKYIDLPLPERYDLATDPGERENLAGRSAERDRTLAATLYAFAAAPPGPRRAEAADAAARLRALGYVSGDAPHKARYTEVDDPKQLVALDQAMHDAVEAFGAGRSEEAVRTYQQVIGRRPDMAIAYRHLAFVEWQRGNLSLAIDVLQRAIRAGVTETSVVAQLGGYLADAGQTAQAIRMLEPLANPADADVDTLNSLGIAYARAGRRPDAGRAFERVLAINPQSSVPLENLGMLALERSDLPAARQHFERAVRVDPRSSRAHADLGVVASRSGDHTTAIEEWKRAVQLDRTNYDALYNLGTTLAHHGQPDAARSYLEQFARTAPASRYASDLREVSRILRSLR
ncbi:MAG: sulfatase-like hydrolase/transferase [Acidobacteria bacterium]|nr:sulfatase-like hydrolase/transferase [Acidobacteriota bacterium]